MNLKEIHSFARGNKINMFSGMSQPEKEDFVLAMMKFRVLTKVTVIIFLWQKFRIVNIAESPISQYIHGPALKQTEAQMDRRSFMAH